MGKVTVPNKGDAAKVLDKSVTTAHAAKCGTCACKCACRYTGKDMSKKSPW